MQADEILYSPLVRAAETARHISEITKIPRRMEPRLREQNFGKWEGTSRHGAEFQKAKEENGGGFKLTGEEEENEPEEEPESFEDEELEDFGSYEEAGAVLNELNYRRRTGWIGLVLTIALEVVLIGLTVLVYVLGTLPLPVPAFLALEVFLLGVMMLINHRTV